MIPMVLLNLPRFFYMRTNGNCGSRPVSQSRGVEVSICAVVLLGWLAVCPGLAGAAGFPFFEPVQPPRAVQVMAHRGASGQAPENTRAALNQCIEDGIEWAEVDLRLTRDGRHVLCHDAVFTDGAGKPWTVRDHTLAELLQLDAGSGFAPHFAREKVLSLGDCLAVCMKRLNLYLDCKDVNPEQLAREILEGGMETQVVVYGEVEELRRIRQVSGGKLALMAKWRPGMDVPGFALTNGLAAVEIDAPNLTSSIRESFKKAGIKVQAKVLAEWDKPEVWERSISAGADWLQTDLPEEVMAHALWRRIPRRPVEISLHRGAGRYAPENTMPAFTKAGRLGVNYVEFDVRASLDGTFFLLHDSRLDRTTDGSGPMDKLPAEAIRKLSAGIKFGKPFAPVSIPSLDEFLASMVGAREQLYLDAKAIPPEALAAALKRHDLVARTVVYQSPEYLARLKAIDPRIRRLPPLGKAGDLDGLLAAVEPYAVDVDWRILSKDLIARCHAGGIKVFSDALDENEQIKEYSKAMDWGIDLIQTDHPLRVMRAIELREDRKPQPPEPLRP